jgi:hypothetical protein
MSQRIIGIQRQRARVFAFRRGKIEVVDFLYRAERRVRFRKTVVERERLQGRSSRA